MSAHAEIAMNVPAARRGRPKSGAKTSAAKAAGVDQRANGQASRGHPSGGSVSASTGGPAPGVASPAPEARETARPILDGPPWSERTYERGFVVGAVAGLYLLSDRPGLDNEMRQAAATIVSFKLLGGPTHEGGELVLRLVKRFVAALNGIKTRTDTGD